MTLIRHCAAERSASRRTRARSSPHCCRASASRDRRSPSSAHRSSARSSRPCAAGRADCPRTRLQSRRDCRPASASPDRTSRCNRHRSIARSNRPCEAERADCPRPRSRPRPGCRPASATLAGSGSRDHGIGGGGSRPRDVLIGRNLGTKWLPQSVAFVSGVYPGRRFRRLTGRRPAGRTSLLKLFGAG